MPILGTPGLLRLRDGAGLLLLAALSACPKTPEAPRPPSVGELKQVLAEREKRLASFHIVVSTVEGADAARTARHEFWFRTPNKSRGHVLQPQEVELAFDGTRLRRVLFARGPVTDGGTTRAVEDVPLDLPPAQRAYFLASTFMPFAPEGYRTPLLPMAGVEVKLDGERAVVSVAPGEGVHVRYVLRWPAGDFLEKHSTSEGQTRVLRVLKERCEDALKLCVPVKLEEKLTAADGGVELLGTTEVTQVDFNPELPQDFFSP